MLNLSRDHPSGCWYLGAGGAQYATFRGQPAHRVSWELHQGPIPEGLHILHGCNIVSGGLMDEPAKGCVNPAHLRPGTPKENADDVLRAKALSRARKKREETLEFTVHLSGAAAMQWPAVAERHGLTPDDLFWKKLIPESFRPWLSKEIGAIGQEYPVVVRRSIGGSRLHAELTDPRSGTVCVASGKDPQELWGQLRAELGLCLGDPLRASLAIFKEVGATPDVCALLEADGYDDLA